MILVSLHLRNYKQYAGDVEVEFPPEGTVAIIGSNGAGKTTLFEAIEWCLYSPREIGSESILTRGGLGDPSVKLVLEDPATGDRYVVERRRKRRSVDAEIYKESAPESPLVTGTREVTDFVTRRLIGLGHRAFVSTFLTRQKELSFFGEVRDTERRREVAQLLGFETIRMAQGLLGDERTTARNDSQSLSRQYVLARGERDFTLEQAAMSAAITEATNGIALATVRQANVIHQHAAARTEAERLRQLQVTHGKLQTDIAARAGDMRAATNRIEGADHALAALAIDAEVRAALLPDAADLPTRRAALDVQEEQLALFREASRLRDLIERAELALADAPRQLAKVISTVSTAREIVPSWHPAARPEQLGDHLSTLGAAIAALDPTAAETTARATAEAFQRERDLLRATEERDRAIANVATADQERARLTVDGDPGARHAAAVAARDAAAQQKVEATERGQALNLQIKERQAVIDQITAAAAVPECPTCHQPLSPAAAELAIAPLAAEVRMLTASVGTMRLHYKTAQAAFLEAEAAVTANDEARATLAAVDGQLRSLQATVRDRTDAWERAEVTARAARAHLKTSVAVAEADVESTRRLARLLADIVGRSSAVAQLTQLVTSATADRVAAASDLDALGPITYDEAAHAAARDAHQTAQNALARVLEIDRALARRPEHETTRAEATATLAAASVAHAALQTEQAALAYDPAALHAANAAQDEAERSLRAADQALAAAHSEFDRTQDRERNLIGEHERINDLDRQAQARKRDWDDLERMYKEFGRFDQYVSQTVTPELANYTGELLAEVTDRKYDQVRFDENYGLHVYDGPESFPVSHFSGGERDVAALCARLSLSRFIGAQAVRPPRFLVLDEVFGSLDADRRHHLLQALLQLAGSDGPFRQLFIISHVDDVRSSPALDEVWRVREQNGSSTIENVSRTGAVEEF